ncbi:MAG: Methionine--tRNA ligase [Rhodothermaeota bacterium MED-G12]|nr:MAG: Methionine--tRNA ligase [Rhodothermaeota bacterium MED-G12]
MSTDSSPIIVTSALPYANGPLHLGHLAGAYLTADFFVRYNRLKGEDVLFICGSDEHGVPITIAAEKEGVSPQDIVDRYHEWNKDTFQKMGISFDYYGRTSSAIHHETSQEIFTELYEKGFFKLKSEELFYDESTQMFLPDRYVKGECPNCGYGEAYGDQCEKCGNSLNPTELINPVSALSGETPVRKETQHWYMPLGEMQDKLESWIKTREHWKPNVMGQIKSWLQEGLNDRAATRDLNWGVPVPLEGADGKVLYVWFEAPIGYISATKEWAQQSNNPEAWKKYWKNDEAKLYHFIGKDNIVFHCIMFPIVLMEHGNFILPENVPANEFLNLEGKKLSTSRGWAVWLHDYLEHFEADYLRYALGVTLPESKDSDFSWKDFQNRVNNELVAVFGNFVNRASSFIEKYANSMVPPLVDPQPIDVKMLGAIDTQKQKIEFAYEHFRFREVVQEGMQLARLANKYFTDTEPWKTRKTNETACFNSLHVSIQVVAALSVLMEPILPESMKMLRHQIGLSDSTKWSEISASMLTVGQSLQVATLLFQKIEDESIQLELDKLQNSLKDLSTESTVDYPALKSPIQFDDFLNLDLRVGVIVEVKEVPKSNKLLAFKVDIGVEIRTILSGIKKHVDKDTVIGQKVTVVCNLESRTIMGIESQGMIVMAESPEGRLHFVESQAEKGSILS